MHEMIFARLFNVGLAPCQENPAVSGALVRNAWILGHLQAAAKNPLQSATGGGSGNGGQG